MSGPGRQRRILPTWGHSTIRSKLYANGGRSYFKNCYLSGDIDFIFSDSTAVFDNSQINLDGDLVVGSPSAFLGVSVGLGWTSLILLATLAACLVWIFIAGLPFVPDAYRRSRPALFFSDFQRPFYVAQCLDQGAPRFVINTRRQPGDLSVVLVAAVL